MEKKEKQKIPPWAKSRSAQYQFARGPLPLNPSDPRHPSTDAWGPSVSQLHPRARVTV
jgi:hypothetical protein